jgi:hypothetical protein
MSALIPEFDPTIASCSLPFQSGDTVSTRHEDGLMTVIVVISDKVHCQWLVGTELQQGRFAASGLRLVDRPKHRNIF